MSTIKDEASIRKYINNMDTSKNPTFELIDLILHC